VVDPSWTPVGHMSLQDPMGLTGPGPNLPYVQPNTANPTVDAHVANYPVGADVLGVAGKISAYVQPGTTYPAIPASQLAGGAMGISNNHER